MLINIKGAIKEIKAKSFSSKTGNKIRMLNFVTFIQQSIESSSHSN